MSDDEPEWASYEGEDGVWRVTRVIRARRVSPGFDTTAEAYDWLNTQPTEPDHTDGSGAWSRTCDKCDGTGFIPVPVNEFDDRDALCWKCGGTGTLDHTNGSGA
jgi:hypothetical protein